MSKPSDVQQRATRWRSIVKLQNQNKRKALRSCRVMWFRRFSSSDANLIFICVSRECGKSSFYLHKANICFPTESIGKTFFGCTNTDSWNRIFAWSPLVLISFSFRRLESFIFLPPPRDTNIISLSCCLLINHFSRLLFLWSAFPRNIKPSFSLRLLTRGGKVSRKLNRQASSFSRDRFSVSLCLSASVSVESGSDWFSPSSLISSSGISSQSSWHFPSLRFGDHGKRFGFSCARSDSA